MQRISKNDKTIKYVKDPKYIHKYLPSSSVHDVLLNGKVRTIDYGKNGLYLIEIVDKKIGTGVGDICQVCEAGELIDFGGCYTCNNCSAQLKCGL